jgi:hypothetical protein
MFELNTGHFYQASCLPFYNADLASESPERGQRPFTLPRLTRNMVTALPAYALSGLFLTTMLRLFVTMHHNLSPLTHLSKSIFKSDLITICLQRFPTPIQLSLSSVAFTSRSGLSSRYYPKPIPANADGSPQSTSEQAPLLSSLLSPQSLNLYTSLAGQHINADQGMLHPHLYQLHTQERERRQQNEYSSALNLPQYSNLSSTFDTTRGLSHHQMSMLYSAVFQHLAIIYDSTGLGWYYCPSAPARLLLLSSFVTSQAAVLANDMVSKALYLMPTSTPSNAQQTAPNSSGGNNEQNTNKFKVDIDTQSDFIWSEQQFTMLVSTTLQHHVLAQVNPTFHPEL